jgi:hypothetical protein
LFDGGSVAAMQLKSPDGLKPFTGMNPKFGSSAGNDTFPL